MSNIKNIKKCDNLFKAIISKCSPDFAYISTNEHILIPHDIRRGKNTYEFLYWRMYFNENITSHVTDMIKKSDVGTLIKYHCGYLYMLSEYDMEHLTSDEFELWKTSNGIV